MKDVFKKIGIFLKWIFVFLLYFIALPLLLNMIIGSYYRSNNPIISNVALTISELIILFIVFLFYKNKIIDDFKKIKNDYKNNLDIGFKYYCIALLVMIVSNLMLSLITGDIATNESLNREYLIKYPFYSVIAMVFSGPMIEEIIFRLGFKDCFKKWLPYCIFSAFVFGGLHLVAAFDGHSLAYALKHWIQFLYIIPYGSLGFAFAKAYYDTDNIWTTIIIHMLHNGVCVILISLV